MITTQNLTFTPTGCDHPVFQDVTLTIRPGERVGIVGPSGAGKTTLGYHLCGAHRLALAGVTTGELRLHGCDGLAGAPPGFAGLVGQNPEAQLFCDTVAEEISLGLRVRNATVAAGDAMVESLLARFDHPFPREAALTSLSLGQKQLTAILSMLAIIPKVLLLDEPTSYLDAPTADRLFAHLDGLCRNEGWIVLVIEHDVRRLAAFADRFLRLEHGRLCYDGPPRSFPSQVPLGRPTPRTDSTPPQQAAPAVRFVDIGYGYGKQNPVLHDINLSLAPGEVVALVGHNGAGKSTLLRLAKGLGKPATGRVELAPGLTAKRHVGFMMQNPDAQIFAHTVEVECGYWPTNLGMPAEQRKARVHTALTALGLEEKLTRSPFSLSFGEKRRLCMAAVLVADPAILCLDEPTTGLDDATMARLAAIVRMEAATGKAVLLATHDADFAAATATRIVRLEGGRIVSETPNREPRP